MESINIKEYFDTRVGWFLDAVKQIESDDFGLDEKRQFDAMQEVKNRFLDSIKKDIEQVVEDDGMHDSLLTSMLYWQKSVFTRHAMPALKSASDEHSVSEKDLYDMVCNVHLSLYEKKEKPVTYDVYMRSVQEVADNLSIEEGATIQ
jgi:hypothetical protein